MFDTCRRTDRAAAVFRSTLFPFECVCRLTQIAFEVHGDVAVDCGGNVPVRSGDTKSVLVGQRKNETWEKEMRVEKIKHRDKAKCAWVRGTAATVDLTWLSRPSAAKRGEIELQPRTVTTQPSPKKKTRNERTGPFATGTAVRVYGPHTLLAGTLSFLSTAERHKNAKKRSLG